MTRSARNTIRLGVVALVAWFVGCSDSPGPGDELTDIDPPAPEATVSEAKEDVAGFLRARVAAAANLTQVQPVDADVVFITLPPGTTSDDAASATLRNARVGGTLTVRMSDGGFDPVPFAASTGDVVDIEVHSFTGAVLARLERPVPPRRPPRVVRTITSAGQGRRAEEPEHPHRLHRADRSRIAQPVHGQVAGRWPHCRGHGTAGGGVYFWRGPGTAGDIYVSRLRGDDDGSCAPMSHDIVSPQLDFAEAASGPSASGHGNWFNAFGQHPSRSFHARVHADGSVTGEFVQHVTALNGVRRKNQADINCLRILPANEAVLSGPVKVNANPALIGRADTGGAGHAWLSLIQISGVRRAESVTAVACRTETNA